MRSNRARPSGAVALAVALAPIAACSSASAPEPRPVDVVAAAPSAERPRVEAPHVEPSASAAGSPSEPPPSGLLPGGRPPRLGTGGSTKGTIACGKERCSAPAQGCAWNQTSFDWRCQAPGEPIDDNADVGPTFVVCDDGTDCPQGETCCRVWGNHFSMSTVCVARADVNARCSEELCLDRGTGGAFCPNGLSCEISSATEEGRCVAPKGPATCGGRRRCPESAPYCAMTAGGPKCVARDSADWKAVRGVQRYECTLQSDCNGGEICAWEFGEIEHDTQTYCGKWAPGYMGSLVCEVGKLEPCGNDPECRKTMTCHPRKDGPKWLGTWGSK